MIVNRIPGIDTGGTFTDFVYFAGERERIHKVLSTPAAPERAILQGIRELNIELDGVRYHPWLHHRYQCRTGR